MPRDQGTTNPNNQGHFLAQGLSNGPPIPLQQQMAFMMQQMQQMQQMQNQPRWENAGGWY